MTNEMLLEEKIKASGKKKSFLAEKCGMSRMGFFNCIKNRATFNATQISILCDELNISSLKEKEAIFFAN